MTQQTRSAVERTSAAIHRIRLTPFERALLLDQRPGYSMCFRLAVTVENAVDLGQFRKAVEHAQRRHPLLRARVPKSDNWHWRVRSVDPAMVTAADQRPGPRPIDLELEPGVRVTVVPGTETTLLFDFHHATTDGSGAFHFMADTLLAYAGESCDFVSAEWFEQFRERSATPPPQIAGFKKWLEVFWQSSLRPATPLACQKNESLQTNARVFRQTLDPLQTLSLKNFAKSQSVSVNDVLVRDLFTTVEQWNRDNGRKWSRLRLLIPVSYRIGASPIEPARNHIGYWFVTRTSSEIDAGQDLLHSIQKETLDVKHRDLAACFEGLVGSGMKMPAFDRVICGAAIHMCMATTVFSNVGCLETGLLRPWTQEDGRVVIGGTTINDVELAPPVRPRTHAAFLAMTFRNRLRIQVQYAPQVMPESDASHLLNEFAAATVASGNGARDACPPPEFTSVDSCLSTTHRRPSTV